MLPPNSHPRLVCWTASNGVALPIFISLLLLSGSLTWSSVFITFQACRILQSQSSASNPIVLHFLSALQGTTPPTEPTSTLVLTSSKSHFIDIRFSLTGSKPTSPPYYWAFAGTAKSTFPLPDPESTTRTTAITPTIRTPTPHPISFPCNIHTTWTRLLDSRGDVTTPDEGTTYLLNNGDCLEVGQMRNPETGALQPYQELWTCQPPDEAPNPPYQTSSPSTQPVTAAATALHPTLTPTTPPKAPTRVVVAVLDRPRDGTPTEPQGTRPDTEIKGMVIQIGPHCQGIIEIPPRHRKPPDDDDSVVRVERWLNLPPSGDAMAHEESGTTAWVRDPRSDYVERLEQGLWMDCLWVCGDRGPGRTRTRTRRRVGDVLEDAEAEFVGEWRVVEVEG